MSPWKVPYVDLRGEFEARKSQYLQRFVDVCSDARFILRQEVEELETRLAAYLGVRHCIGVGSGSDALGLALHALGIGPGDEVVTVAHTFVATLAAIHWRGATPVLIDVGLDFNLDPRLLDRALTPRTRAVVAVHMNGRCCDMPAVRRLCDQRGIAVVEDAAQALGASVDGVRAGALGSVACFSFHPMKTLHCFGDGGLISTADAAVAEKVRLLRNHGQRTRTDLAGYGYNSRLDNLQAAILLENLHTLDEDIERKRQAAARYQDGLAGLPAVTLPPPVTDGRYFDTYCSYVILADQRDALRDRLLGEGIEVFVHGDPPLTRQEALALPYSLPCNERLSKRFLSLPIFPAIRAEQVDYVVGTIRSFFERR
jgi:dTDP-4-amino-4,6-dideoxygalactose transaminase